MTVLRLHTDDAGRIWYGDEQTLAAYTGQGAVVFCERYGRLLNGADLIRVVGSRANASLLYQLSLRPGWQNHTQLCSPLSVCGSSMDVLRGLWQPEGYAHLVGNRYQMRPEDGITYRLISEQHLLGTPQEELLWMQLRRHPAWPALAGIPALDKAAALAVICEIVDPRWFRHPQRPDRLSRLFSYLGLSPQNAAAYTSIAAQGRHFDRAAKVFRIWYSSASLSYHYGRPLGPEDYLWRICLRHKEEAKGLLRASLRLMTLVAKLWLNKLLANNSPESLFDPTAYFRDFDEQQVFLRHWLRAP